MSSLYTINQEILNCIDLETGEITDFDKFEALQMERNEKLENIALWVKNLLSEAEALKAEEKAFAEREKKARNKAESLKRYLDSALNGQKFNTTKVAISYRKSTSVDVLDVEKLPEAYRKTVTTVSADKTAISAALKAGELVDGATLVEKNNLSIK